MSIPHLTQLDIKLTDAVAALLLNRLEASEGDSQKSKRRSNRLDLRGVLLPITVLQDHEPVGVFRVRMRNVSQHGVGFLSRAAMTPGAVVTLHLPIGPNSRTVDKRAVIRRCSHVEGMIYDIGAEFGDAPSANDEE